MLLKCLPAMLPWVFVYKAFPPLLVDWPFHLSRRHGKAWEIWFEVHFFLAMVHASLHLYRIYIYMCIYIYIYQISFINKITVDCNRFPIFPFCLLHHDASFESLVADGYSHGNIIQHPPPPRSCFHWPQNVGSPVVVVGYLGCSYHLQKNVDSNDLQITCVKRSLLNFGNLNSPPLDCLFQKRKLDMLWDIPDIHRWPPGSASRSMGLRTSLLG